MDRPTSRMDADPRGSRPLPHEPFVLPSRRPALDQCRSLLGFSHSVTPNVGPILLTGDTGVGKTWLCRLLEAEAATQVRWISIELTPSNSPADLFRLISHELGLTESGASASGRVDLIDHLAERQADGQRINLVIDEAQNLTMPVWEEVRILANRLDRSGGFSKMILVGQTSLARRFATRPFAAIEARLSARIHLGPIDADEAVELVARANPTREWTLAEVEILHRDAAGNPRRILRQLGPAKSVPKLASPPTEAIAVEKVEAIDVDRPEPRPAVSRPAPGPLTGPAKPPIRVDENMIEVGWSPEESAESIDSDERLAHPEQVSSPSAGGEEAVLDHYAALQAWREWTENQARRTQTQTDPEETSSTIEPERLDDSDPDEEEVESDLDDLPPPRFDRSRVRIEAEQKFAPFGQLFSRMAQSHDPE